MGHGGLRRSLGGHPALLGKKSAPRWDRDRRALAEPWPLMVPFSLCEGLGIFRLARALPENRGLEESLTNRLDVPLKAPK